MFSSQQTSRNLVRRGESEFVCSVSRKITTGTSVRICSQPRNRLVKRYRRVVTALGKCAQRQSLAKQRLRIPLRAWRKLVLLRKRKFGSVSKRCVHMKCGNQFVVYYFTCLIFYFMIIIVIIIIVITIIVIMIICFDTNYFNYFIIF